MPSAITKPRITHAVGPIFSVAHSTPALASWSGSAGTITTACNSTSPILMARTGAQCYPAGRLRSESGLTGFANAVGGAS